MIGSDLPSSTQAGAKHQIRTTGQAWPLLSRSMLVERLKCSAHSVMGGTSPAMTKEPALPF